MYNLLFYTSLIIQIVFVFSAVHYAVINEKRIEGIIVVGLTSIPLLFLLLLL